MDDLKLRGTSLSTLARQQIYKYIERMDLESSNKLPREEVLARIVGVSRVTIRKALDDLAAEGIIFRRQGKGTFVNVNLLNIKVKFNPAMEFTQMIRECGYEPSVKHLSVQIIPWNKTIGRHLQLDDTSTLVMSEKFFLADGKICAYSIDYFALELIGGMEGFDNFSLDESSIFDYLYHLSNEKIEWDKIEIDTVLGREIPHFLQHVSKENYGLRPYLRIRGVNYNQEDQPRLYLEEYIDTSLIKFSMIRQKMIHYPT